MYGTYSMMPGGGSVAEASSFAVSTVIPAQAGIQSEESVPVESAPTAEIDTLAHIIYIVDEAIKEKPDNIDGILELKAVLEGWAKDILAEIP